jgi:uncharacterized tellurite resistance protein B-like protein
VSIRKWLGLDSDASRGGAAETETVRKVVQALDGLDEARARYIAAFGYILSRVAHADLHISTEETATMEHIVSERGGLSPSEAIIVVQMAKTRTQMFSGTENFLVTREFDRMADRDQKLALLDCLFAVAATDDGVSVAEDNEIKQVSQELHLDHPEYIGVRQRWRDQLNVLKERN